MTEGEGGGVCSGSSGGEIGLISIEFRTGVRESVRKDRCILMRCLVGK